MILIARASPELFILRKLGSKNDIYFILKLWLYYGFTICITSLDF